eukprot:PhM_4_TR2410/c1_g1_i1/m.27691
MFSEYASSTFPYNQSALTDESNARPTSRKVVSSGRAYLVLPTFTGSPSAMYRVCFMANASNLMNWMDLGLVTVQNPGFTFAVDGHGTSPPHVHHGSEVTLRLLSDGRAPFDTNDEKLCLKLISLNDVCLDPLSDAMPMSMTGNTSKHLGIEVAHRWYIRSSNSTLATHAAQCRPLPDRVRGTAFATFRVTLPHVGDGVAHYKVCVKGRTSLPWVLVNQVGDAGSLVATARAPASLKVTLSTKLFTRHLQRTVGNAQDVAALSGGAATVVGRHATTLNLSAAAPVVTVSYDELLFNVSGATTSTELKFVPVVRVNPIGTWSMVVSPPHCSSPAFPSIRLRPAVVTHLPSPTGLYLICVRSSATSAWTQPEVADVHGVPYPNPVMIAHNMLEFTAAPNDMSALQIRDRFVNRSNVDESFGSLMAWDYVYLVNSSHNNVCGFSAPYYLSAMPSYGLRYDAAQLIGRGNSSGTLGGVYPTLETVPHPPNNVSLATSSFWPVTSPSPTTALRLCYFKQSDPSRVNATNSSAAPPLLRGGVWYAVDYGGADYEHGAGTEFYLPNGKTSLSSARLAWTCPPCNSSYLCRTGHTYEIKVDVLDENGLPVHTQVSVSTQTNFDFHAQGDTCPSDIAASFGWPSTAAVQLARHGATTFRITPMSNCLSSSDGMCTLRLTSPGTPLSSSATCKFRILNVGTRSLSAATVPTTCSIGRSKCRFVMHALAHDGDVDRSNNVRVYTSMKQYAGVKFSLTDPSSGFFVGGVYTFDLLLSVDTGTASLWQDAAPHIVELTVTAAHFVTTISFSVPRPALHHVDIVDITPVSPFGGTVNDLHLNQVSKWEPVGTYPQGHWVPAQRLSSVVADGSQSPEYYLEAGQYYKVTLRAVDSGGSALPSPDFFPNADINVVSPHPANAIIASQSGSTADPHYSVPFSSVRFRASEQSVVFRLKNGRGCEPSLGGCRISFLFGNKAFNGDTFIETSVRSHASRLRVACGTPALSSCPISHVELGYDVVVEAVDSWGNVDEFMNGTAVVFLDAGTSVPAPKITSVALLGSNSVPTQGMVTARFVGGRAEFVRTHCDETMSFWL